MLILSFVLMLVSMILFWLGREVMHAEKSHGNFFSSSDLPASFDQEKLGKLNGPVAGIKLTRGVKLKRLKSGNFKIIPTAKYDAEYYNK